jgi:hypothetical protein
MTGAARVRRQRRLATNELQSLASDSLARRKVTPAASPPRVRRRVARCRRPIQALRKRLMVLSQVGIGFAVLPVSVARWP